MKWWIALGLCLVCCQAMSQEHFLFDERRFSLPLRVNIGLLGFEEDGNFEYRLDRDRFRRLLETSLSSHIPSSLESQRQINTEFQLDFNVVPISVEGYENVLIEAFQKANELRSEQSSSTEYNLPITMSFQNYFDALLLQYFPQATVSPAPGEYAIFLANPSKTRIAAAIQLPAYQIPEFAYQLSYLHTHVGGQTWMSPNRYLVMDLTAGPAEYGPLHISEGTISKDSIPRLSKYLSTSHSKSSVEIEGSLTRSMLSAIRCCLIPDLMFDGLSHAEKILIPIIVLRNHHSWDPWVPKTDYSIDLGLIKREIQKMAAPGQDITIVTGLHSLHEHRHLSMVLAKSKKADSLYEVDLQGRFHLKLQPYLDSSELYLQLSRVEDLLGSGLISLSAVHQRAFFNPNVPDPLIDEMLKADKKTSEPSRSQGTRVIPVFVFSLIGEEKNLLLEDFSLFHSTKDSVIVLQTNEEAIPVPYFSSKHQIYADGRKVTRHIIAGLAQVLGGIAEPTKRYSPLHGRVVNDFTWALGHHPFGFLSNFTGLSQFHIDLSLRNAVLSRIDHSVSVVKDSMEEMNQFVKEYLFNPFEKNLTVAHSSAWHNWIDDLYHSPIPDSMSPVASSTIYHLHKELIKFEERFQNIAQLLHEYKLEEAYKMTISLSLAASTFRKYAKNQLEAAENALLCCYLKTDVKSSESPLFFIVLALCFVVLLFFIFRKK